MTSKVKIMSVILVFALLVGVLPPRIMAIQNSNSAEQSEEKIGKEIYGKDYIDAETTLITGEDKSLRKENEKHFRHKDGSYSAVLYAAPVHYKDSFGNWQDVDNSLVMKSDESGNAVYSPTASGNNIQIPRTFSDGQTMLVEKDGYKIELGIMTDRSIEDMQPGIIASPEVPIGENPNANSSINANDILSALPSEDSIADIQGVVREEESNAFNSLSASTPLSAEEANARTVNADTHDSTISYSDLFNGDNLEYTVSSDRIKESIIVQSQKDKYIYAFSLMYDGLNPVSNDDGSISFFGDNEETPVFKLAAPYMYDAADEISEDVEMFLYDSMLFLVADEEWINDEERVFPITIDPTVVLGSSSFKDTYVSSAAPLLNYSDKGILKAGSGGLLFHFRAYMKFDLPLLPAGSVVSNATLSIWQSSGIVQDQSRFCVYDLTGKGSWDADKITWRNQIVNKDLDGYTRDKYSIVDCVVPNETEGYNYLFNLTRVVRGWYENGNNNGIMFAYNFEEFAHATYFCSAQASSGRPSLIVNYNHNVGLEDYWSYQTADLGRSGEVSINNYSGGVTYLHSDIAMTGNRLPISVSHIYNSEGSSAFNSVYPNMNLGGNYHLNIQELLLPISASDSLYGKGYRYRLYDSDGTVHLFNIHTNSAANSEFVAQEYDETSVVTQSGSSFILTDSQGNKKHYNSSGQLYKIEDRNHNIQTIEITDGRITKVTDPANRAVILNYSGNLLTSITDPSGRAVTYAYTGSGSNSKLTRITYPGGKTTVLEYFSDCYLKKVTAVDGSSVALTYYQSHGCGKRTERFYKYNKSGAETDCLYFVYAPIVEDWTSSGSTRVTNKDGDYVNFGFDTYGRAVSVTDQDNRSFFTSYGSSVSAENINTFNDVLAVSEMQSIATNFVWNSGFEYGVSGWTGADGVISDEIYSTGFKSACLANGHWSIEQNIKDLIIGKTYILSADIYIPERKQDSYLNVSFSNERLLSIQSTEGWERISVPMTSISRDYVEYLEFSITGSGNGFVAYVDNVALENGEGTTAYNLVENADFMNYSDSTSHCVGADASRWSEFGYGITRNYNSNSNTILMNGDMISDRVLTQSVSVNAEAGETVIIGGTAAARAMSSNFDGVNTFGIRAVLYKDSDTVDETLYIPFDPLVDGGMQTVARCYKLKNPCHHIVYSFVYEKNINEMALKNAFIYVDGFGEHYGYNDIGLVSDKYNDEGTAYEYSYENNNVSLVSRTVSGIEETVAENTYDANGNQTETVNNDGTSITTTYAGGLPISKTVSGSGDETYTEQFSYYPGGNYLATYTDYSGGVTQFFYDNNTEVTAPILKGLLTKIIDANGNVKTFAYDANTDEMISASGAVSVSENAVTALSYQGGNVSSVVRGGTTYSYSYDGNNNVTRTKVGANTLSQLSYNDRGLLTSQTYGNGAVYTPTFDSRRRLVSEKWGDTQTAEYSYDVKDRVMTSKDLITDVSYRYQYAFYDLPHRITGSDGSDTVYRYDRSGMMTEFTFSKNADTLYSSKYRYNSKGNPEDIEIPTFNNALLHYNYDELGRVTGFSNGKTITEVEYTGADVSGYMISNTDGQSLYQLSYTRDANGNITGVIDPNYDFLSAEYEYDGLDRLIKAEQKNKLLSFDTMDEIVYNYNSSGNIMSVKLNGETVHTYTYGNVSWPDQLTAFDGKSITYDASGNPLSYGAEAFTWRNGTQLASYSADGSYTYTYQYDANGNRVKKVCSPSDNRHCPTDYVYANGLLISEKTDLDSEIRYAYGADSEPIGLYYEGDYFYFVKNVCGDVIAIVDSTGRVKGEYLYDPYGNLLDIEGWVAHLNPFRYRGYYYDKESGLYYVGSRYYNPEWGRFISPDSLFIAGDLVSGSNMYAYCDNNPIMHTDSQGTAASGNKADQIADGVRKTSKVISIALWPATGLFFLGANRVVLPAVKNYLSKDNPAAKDDFAQTDFMQNYGIPALSNMSKAALPIFGGDRTHGVPSGLRHIMPVDMRRGAVWAAYFLGFESSKYSWNRFGLFPFENYTTVEGKYMWQQEVGYSWWYDYFFSLGGPIKRLMLKFDTSGNGNSSPVYYVIWCWKADYWNLGAGAEIGIYSTDVASNASANFYEIDPQLTVHTRMKIDYTFYQSTSALPTVKMTLNDFHQTNWWVTSFTPSVQLPDINRLDVELNVRFTGDNYYPLMKAFRDEYNKPHIIVDENGNEVVSDWSYVGELATATKVRPIGHSAHVCGKKPESCTCVCPLGDNNCSWPCSYYSVKCTDNCAHINEPENGFQFKITY